jgi:uncharacterized protein involved in exopolysaccharide biosynthesis
MERRNINGIFGRRRHARPSHSSLQDSRIVGPRDVLRILFRHKIKVVSFFVSTVAVAIIGLFILPKTYTSEARLYIKIGRHSVGVSPTANVGTSLTIHESHENEIRSMIDLVRSRTILQRVVDRIGPHVILKGSLDATPEKNAKEEDPKMLADKAIKKLSKDIEAGSGRKSSVIAISCKSNSPELSQKIVTVLIATYRSHHLDVNSTNTFEFFGKQLKVIESETQGVSGELAALKTEIGLSSINGQETILEKTVTDLNREMQLLEANISEAKVRVRGLKAASPELDLTKLSTSSALTPTALDNMREELYRLQIQKRRSEASNGPKHPAMKALISQVAKAESDLRREELIIAASNLQSYEARRVSIQKSYQDAQRQLHLLLKHEASINQYEERLAILKERHISTAKRMEESRMADELDAEEVSNIRVEQPASFIPKAVSPKKYLVLLLGLVAGSIGGLGLATTCEFLDHSYKTPEQLESSLNLPVLLSIPHTPGHQSPLNRRY